MSEKRLYPKCAGMMKELVEKLEAKYGQEGYETQFLTFEEEEQKGGVFQLRPKSGGWQTVKDVTGMGTAATVTMKMVGQALEVEIGGGKWFDKAAVLGISMVVLWPLTITASIGALGQRSLLKQLLADVEDFFRKSATVPKCPECNADNPAAAKFCNACGKPME
jgi:hypothetical protein